MAYMQSKNCLPSPKIKHEKQKIIRLNKAFQRVKELIWYFLEDDMQLLTAQYHATQGWNKKLDAALDSSSTLLIIFGSSHTENLTQGFEDLRMTFPLATWIGCSTSGEIYGETLADHSLVIAVVKFSRSTLRLAHGEIDQSTHSFQVGKQLADQLSAPDLKAIFVVSDGLHVNGSELAKGLAQNLPAQVVVTGGLAGDGEDFQQTWVIADQSPQNKQVVAVGLYGDHVGVAYGSNGGWVALGSGYEVTHSVGNVLYSLDNEPALAVYKAHLGELAEGLPKTGLLYPLAIRSDLEGEDMLVRTILAVDEADQSITFAGDIPQGTFAQWMKADANRLIDAAMNACEQLDLHHYVSGALLTVAVSCVGRRLVLAKRTKEELDAVLFGIPKGGDLIGFYSYGELSPLNNGQCDLHNQTMTLTSFWELGD
jgi:hypothetical protein